MPSIKFSRIWKIASPIIAGNVAQNLLIITDTAFLGRLDAVSLGAAALGGVFYLAVMMLGLGFSIGVQIIVARRYGEERYDSIGAVFHHALLFMIPFAAVLWCLLWFKGYEILSFLIKSPDVLQAAGHFLDMRVPGILFGFVIYICQAFFVGIARTKIILPVTCTVVTVNIALAWAMVFGHLGFAAMGIRGAALASAISEMAGAAVYFFYIWIYRKQDFRRFGLFRRFAFSASVMLNLIKISVPASLQNFLSVASWFIFFIVVEKIGEHELAVSNIGRSLYAIFLLPVWGFASAVNSLASYSIGCRKPLLVYPVTAKVAFITALSVLLMEGLVHVFPGAVTSIYTSIPSLGAATVEIMPAISISALFFAVGFICFNAVSGTGNTHISLLIEIIGTCIYVAICVLAVEIWHWGIMYVWLADGFYGAVMIAASLIYLGRGKWMRRKV